MEKARKKYIRIFSLFLKIIVSCLVLLVSFGFPTFSVKAEEEKEAIVYVVKAGDTLSQIAVSFDTTVEILLAENEQITNPNVLYVGQELFIPSVNHPPRTIIISPTNGPAGSTPQLNATGFDPYLDIQLLVGPEGTETVLSYTEKTNASGMIQREIQIPENAEPGEHWVVAIRPLQDPDDYLERSNTFLVTADGEKGGAEESIIFLVAVGDGGDRGKKIGCDDSLVPVTVKIDRSTEPIRATLTALLDIGGPYHGQSGLYNSLYQSELAVDRIDVNDAVAYVYLEGTKKLGGTCDTPRFRQQIIETANQFSNIRDVRVYINGEHAFSERNIESKDDLRVYSVQPNDTLSHIAVSFDTKIESLVDLNPQIQRPSLIVVGQKLVIPGTDDDSPHVTLMPTNGVPGTEATIRADNLRPNTLYQIGVGRANSEYDVVTDILSDDEGRIYTQVNIPEYAEEDEFWVVVLDCVGTQ